LTLESPEIYQTTDTATAAYLCISNFKLLSIKADNHKATFLFELSESLKEAAHSFEIGTAIGNVGMFWRQYRKLLKEIRGNNSK